MKVGLETSLWVASAAVAYLADRASKDWALSSLELHRETHWLHPFLDFYLVKNSGAAFSMGKDNSQLVLVVAVATTVCLIVWSFYRLYTQTRAGQNAPLERIGAGLIAGSSLGNLVDRFTQGRVTDFLQFGFFDFPVFNLADALIDVGIVLLFIQMLLLERAKK